MAVSPMFMPTFTVSLQLPAPARTGHRYAPGTVNVDMEPEELLTVLLTTDLREPDEPEAGQSRP